MSDEKAVPKPKTMSEKVEELRQKRDTAYLGGGADRLEKQRAQGKLTARERIDYLLDPESFQEYNLFARHRATFFGLDKKEFAADGVVTGSGYVDARQVFVASQDFSVGGGAVGEVHGDKIVEMMNLALKTGSPMVIFNDSGGARIQEGIDKIGRAHV